MGCSREVEIVIYQFFEIVWILSSFNVYLTLTITEYAQTFDLSPHNVRNKVNSGELPAEQIGNKWIIQVDETEVSLNQELNPLLIKNFEQRIEDLKEQLAQKDVQTDQFLGKKIDYNKTDDMFILWKNHLKEKLMKV